MTNFFKTVPDKLFDEFLGPKDKRVAVLGAFDTWPYMHKICTEIASSGYTAVTSKYIYQKNEKTKSGYMRVARTTDNMSMNDFLLKKVIKICDLAIIIYSVPAAHYNEAEWCDKNKIRTLGIAFVRNPRNEGDCEDCVIQNEMGLSFCIGEGNAWTCISRDKCPFKDQGIAKNQIEYFLDNPNMNLISVEKIENTKKIIKKFLRDELKKPTHKHFVFQFRFDLEEKAKKEMESKFEKLLEKMEDFIDTKYEYIDYYFKPMSDPIETWLKKKSVINMRQRRKPPDENVKLFYTKVEQSSKGFFCRDPNGSILVYEGDIEKAERLLEDINMEYFMKVIKIGDKIFLEGAHQNIYLEKLQIENQEKELLTYGYSLEVESHMDNKKSEKTEEITKNIVDKFGLKKCNAQIIPVQEFLYFWQKNQQTINDKKN